jgi:hypothetical protein
MTADHTSSQIPDQHQSEPEQEEHRLVRWLKARRWDADFWFHYTLFPWLRTKARPWAARRLREIGSALDDGWSGTVAWIRAVLSAVVALVFLTTLGLFGQLAVDFWQHTLIGTHHQGLLATVTGPVHAYITAHAVGLPTDAATVWALWQLAAPVLLILSMTGSLVARVAWCGYGAGTAAAVWMAAPDPGRPVALALTVTAWALASILALHGLRLGPLVVVSRPIGRSTRAARAALPPASADRVPEPGI